MVSVRVIFCGIFLIFFLGVFIKIVIPLIECEMTIANSVLDDRRAVIGQLTGSHSSLRPAKS